MNFYFKVALITLAIIAALGAGVSVFLVQQCDYLLGQTVYAPISKSNAATVKNKKLANPPKIIKSVYMTGYSAGSKSYINYLNNLLADSQINAVVIDVKGSEGYVSYNSEVEDVQKYNLSNRAISDIDGLIKFFHEKNIYVIGRIVVFEDSKYAKARPNLAVYNTVETINSSEPVLWKTYNGSYWVDPASKDVWNYNISLAKDAFYHGFDEINFDYVRFPSDGKMKEIGFPVWDKKLLKSDVIKSFFEFTREQLKGQKISVDLFGLTTVNYDDLGVGQIIEEGFKNFDFVCPMVYPSHYADGFIGLENPAEYPYEVVKYSLDRAKNRLGAKEKLRPWLQDFNMGATYTVDMVSAEIKATIDSLGEDYIGFMLWNPRNIYTKPAITLEPQ
jgi:hypothetical protein